MVYDLDSVVRVKMFGRVTQNKGGWHNGICALSNILLYGLEGEMHIEMMGEQFTIREGDVLLIPVGVLYRPLEGGRCTYFFIHYVANILPDTTETPCQPGIVPHQRLAEGYGYSCICQYASVVHIPIFTPTAPTLVRYLFERAEKLNPGKYFTEQLYLDNLLREMLIGLNDTSERNKNGNIRLDEITDYIKQHYSENLALSVLAKRFSLSESYIARLFREQIGQTSSEYVNGIRISVASMLLVESNLTVTEIAGQIGFSDVYYFSKVFKKTLGCSPKHWRRR